MAAAGLPKTGRIGYELFDKTNLGATEFVEHINYRRALEGELERSVMALSEVEQARVHVTFPRTPVFLVGDGQGERDGEAQARSKAIAAQCGGYRPAPVGERRGKPQSG